jgi:putrescine transport system permease protein
MAQKTPKSSLLFDQILQNKWIGRNLLVGIPYVWLIIFFLIPFAIVLQISFSEVVEGMPPYKPLLEWITGKFLHVHLNIHNYIMLFTDDIYGYAFWQSIKLASICTSFCLFMGYPMAYYMARSNERTQPILLLLVMLPFWSSFLLRVYAWMGILGNGGIINTILLSCGVIDQPISLLYNDFSVALGMIYCYLPFMILPLYATLVKLDMSLLEAAADLGCTPFKVFLNITLPLSKTGVISGCILVFIPSMGEFVIPELLGGSESFMLGKLIWTEFFSNRDWPVASAIAICMIILMIVPLVFVQRFHTSEKS